MGRVILFCVTCLVFNLPSVGQVFWRSDTFCIGATFTYSYGYRQNNVPPQRWDWTMVGGTPTSKTSTDPTDSSMTVTYGDDGEYRIDLVITLADGSPYATYALIKILDPAPPS